MHLNPVYVNCYTFNEQPYNEHWVERAGEKQGDCCQRPQNSVTNPNKSFHLQGLELNFRLNSSDFTDLTVRQGLRVALHDNGQAAVPQENGLVAELGYLTTVIMSVVRAGLCHLYHAMSPSIKHCRTSTSGWKETVVTTTLTGSDTQFRHDIFITNVS